VLIFRDHGIVSGPDAKAAFGGPGDRWDHWKDPL
jgi:hypothetical protein